MSGSLPDRIRGLRLKIGATFIGISVLVLVIGEFETIRGFSKWFGFTGSLTLLVPTLHLEFSKLEISKLRQSRAHDPQVQAAIESEIGGWESGLARYHAWHSWCRCLGIALLALAFRSSL